MLVCMRQCVGAWHDVAQAFAHACMYVAARIYACGVFFFNYRYAVTGGSLLFVKFPSARLAFLVFLHKTYRFLFVSVAQSRRSCPWP